MNDDEQKELQSRIELFGKEYQALLDKHNLTLRIELDFPEYRKLPPEVELAVLILNKHNAQYAFMYANKPKEEPKK